VSRPTALVLGEALVDYHGDESLVGGAPLHVAAQLASLGWSSHLLTRVGEDEDGARIGETMARHGIDTSMLQTDPDHPTGRADVLDEDSGLTRFEIRSPVAWDFIAPPDMVPRHDVLHYGTLASRSDVSRQTMERVVGMSTARLKTCDINLREPRVGDDVVEWALGQANLIKLSSEELEVVAVAGAGSLLDRHPQLELIAVTSGSEGATLIRRGSQVSREPPDVEIVDTVGAGDAFTAGLIDALFRGATDEMALEAASSSAARALGSPGALPR